jgi:Family of unknown function (DUF5994)
MTTIRRTRTGPSGSAAGNGGPAPRIALLDPVPGEHTTLEGAWWPRSRDLARELPALITALHRRGVRYSRVTYNQQSWDAAPRRLDADGRVIRLGWFQHLDPHLLNLSGGDDGRSRLDLLVVPPDAEGGTAARAMSAASARENHENPTALLDGLGERHPAG